ncbi:hypothetical protein ZIOFF_048090 [Zingiber officinale]|uniref:dUTP diphosphatase n=1 Tax=Zingiber officinale TaxID=94328 RepID=A0A8J5KWC5_ZINOF|nr:hypothetical protein ZIOFF_048090 [Zingiber officinale]
MALIIFRDNRWQDDRSVIAAMEVDLTRGSQLIYVIPDIMMTIGDFFRNIQLSILTRGYESWRNGEANLLITRGLIGRLSNTPNIAFAYEVNGVVDYLTSHGIVALPRRRYSTAQLQGLNWVIRPSQLSSLMQSTEVNSSNLLDGRISLSFHNYTAAPILRPPLYNNHDEEVPSDEERLLTHTIAVLIEESVVQVKRLTRTTEIPKRQSEETVGYDLMADAECTIEPHGRGLVSTGLCLAIPSGFYGRIATWSDAAL